jgi:hypothetical protein
VTDATMNGNITFRDNYGNHVDVVEELKKLRESVSMLVRLSNVAIGNVSLAGLASLQPQWFTRVFHDHGQGWTTGLDVAVGSEVHHYDSGIKAKISWSFVSAEDQWQFINTLKLIIASRNQPLHGSVESLLRAVLGGLPDAVDAVSRLAALKAACLEPSSDAPETASRAQRFQPA